MKKLFIAGLLCMGFSFVSTAQDYAMIAGEYCGCYKKLKDTIPAEFQQLLIRVAKSDDPKTAFTNELNKMDAQKRLELSEQLSALGTIMDSEETEAGRCGLALDKKYVKFNDTPAKEKEFNKKMAEELKKGTDCEFLWAVSVFALAFSEDQPQMDIELLRSICLSFPAATEDIKWESNLCFCVGGKMFCIADLEPPHSFSFKVNDEEFDELSESDGFKPAPYLARAKWVLVFDSSRLNRQDLKNYLRHSYDLIKAKIPKAQRKKLGLD